MKRIKLILSLMAAFLLMIGSSAVTAAASYKYRVTIDPGLHGTYSGTAEMEIPYGSTWNPADYEDNITVTDSDYYFKGFHISGIEGVVGTTDITEDTVFVASYGMKGKTVAYTVNYVDTSGKTLRASATYQGNVGDKPVVAFRYIDGYLPQAYNLEKTLSSDSTKNVFEFEYKKVTPKVVGKSGSGGVTYIVEDGGVVYIQLPSGNTGKKGYAASASNTNANNVNSAENQTETVPATESDLPKTIIDLDQDPEGMAETSGSADGMISADNGTPESRGLGTGIMLGIGAGSAGLLALLIALFMKSRPAE
ncbi:MAG: hypothetical protein IJI75_11585 [Solobacterium sp.]|nr:hypothetical protein [Solobacterium sp.]